MWEFPIIIRDSVWVYEAVGNQLWGISEYWLTLFQSLVLIATLVAVIVYTWKTHKLAKSSKESVALQDQELGLRKRPVVAFFLEEEGKFFTRPKIINFSYAHAKIRVKLTIKYDNRILEIPESSYYSGKVTWPLQAMGSTRHVFYGNMDLPNIFEKNDLSREAKNYCEIAFELWVINYYDNEEYIFEDINKNPVLQWNWTRGRWVPEAKPALVH